MPGRPCPRGRHKPSPSRSQVTFHWSRIAEPCGGSGVGSVGTPSRAHSVIHQELARYVPHAAPALTRMLVLHQLQRIRVSQRTGALPRVTKASSTLLIWRAP